MQNTTITYALKWDLYQSVVRLSVSLVVTIRKKMMHPARHERSGTHLSCCSISLGLQTDLVIGTDRARFCCFVCLCGSLLSICVRWNLELGDFHVFWCNSEAFVMIYLKNISSFSNVSFSTFKCTLEYIKSENSKQYWLRLTCWQNVLSHFPDFCTHFTIVVSAFTCKIPWVLAHGLAIMAICWSAEKLKTLRFNVINSDMHNDLN